MTKTRVLIASVVVLAILNVALLSFTVLNKPGHHKKNKNKHQIEQRCHKNDHKKGQKKSPKKGHKSSIDKTNKFEGVIGNKLGFSEEQKTEFKTLKKAHFEQVKEQHEAKRAITKELFSLLKSEVVDADQKAKLIAESVALEQKMVELKFNHFIELKNICNPEQLEGFFEMIEKMENKMPERKGRSKEGSKRK